MAGVTGCSLRFSLLVDILEFSMMKKILKLQPIILIKIKENSF